MGESSAASTPPVSWRNRFNLSRLAIEHSRLTIAFWLAVIVAGFLAFSSLKYALFPDITFPVVVITAQAPDLTAADTEQQLTVPLEASVRDLEALEFQYSTTYAGQAVLNLAFTTGQSLKSSATSVKSRLDSLPLPDSAKVEIIPFDLNESAVISYALTSDRQPTRELLQTAQTHFIPELGMLPGVLKVNLLGNDSGESPLVLKEAEPPVTPQANFPTLVRFNGEAAIALEVIKHSDANTLEVVDQVEQTIAQLRQDWPDIQVNLAANQATYIQEATQSTIDALMLAIALAILVLFPFLRNWQATLITALAIPISLLGTCVVMAMAEFNLETITLLALALVIGIIVDDAIVEVENITRHIEAGQTPRQAAMSATREIGLTVSAATLTIVAVFLPVAFMGGTLGQFFKPFGLTVSAAVLISLLVARTLSPVLAVYWLRPKEKRRFPAHADPLSSSVEPSHSSALSSSLPGTTTYRHLLRWALTHRPWVISLAITCLVAGIALIPLIPQGFIPSLDRGEFNIVYTTPLPKVSNRLRSPQTDSPDSATANETKDTKVDSLEHTTGAFRWLSELAKSPEKILLRRTRRFGEQIETAVLRLPEVETAFTTVGVQGRPNQGKIYVRLKGDRTLNTAQVQAKLRQTLPHLAGISLSVEDLKFVNTESEKTLQIVLTGEDLVLLSQTAQALQAKIETLPGYVDIAVSNSVTPGADATQIEHINGQRGMYFSANLAPGYTLGNATEQVLAAAQALKPKGVEIQRWGDSAHSSIVLSEFLGTLTLSVICMLIALIIPFGRLLEPLVVGLSLPLSIVGAMLALLVTHSDFGIISLIGLIFLLGLLDKNAILLMDYVNQLRATGMNRTEAIIETGAVRLRPILMTTASTILGMTPIALGLGTGAELRQPMAVAIIGGLLTASLLSLIVVPVLYTLLEDGWTKIAKIKA